MSAATHKEVNTLFVVRQFEDLITSRCISEGSIIDSGQLVCLYLLTRLLQRELEKCFRLVSSLPMQDMDRHFGDEINVHAFNKQ